MVKRKITTIRLVDELDELIGQEAQKKGISRNAVIIEALWQYIKKEKDHERTNQNT
ncbi:ribbon-helix-helix protein, CopG family [Melissococcus plutonius]|uniref:ribbon-helix-helix protein, CopG family n=1 Tax=Melissococcus plutonius TaxID=33970 RepID=UPI0021E5CCD8|nr:ribbon-helix-helix protein, CopG family [Melissococcus plutonius]MCV2499679.1 ribbon-helix-helix protein, CopG family [Melissococcus plutonius]MCV2501981.1 ribbon-helix-helix protein, CopG family [Melissococcus plutonius]MCV2508287.1 ribbon-helix-helix protein, CopG family [Melissococcus plutonius]MCV2528119.1 ribbon-helix-helix protein, CopG family [Melissococcus plutonius]